MRARTACQVTALALLAAGAWLTDAAGHGAMDDQRLSKIGPAADFTLVNQEGRRVAYKTLRGSVLAITFVYASCTDTCPLLTAKMASIQNRLGSDFGTKVRFVSITVDPERDTPGALKRYAEAHGANLNGWDFLTGTSAEIRVVAKRYGIVYRRSSRGGVDHSFLTSLVDQHGTLRVQYIGVGFDPDEMLRDLRRIVDEQAEPD